MRYFVTGASGFIGKRLVRKLLARRGSVVYFLMREASRDKVPALLEYWGVDAKRAIAVYGDLAQPKLGLSRGAIKELGAIDHFFHLAAVYDLKADADSQIVANIEGTRNAVALANEIEAGCFQHMLDIGQRLARLGFNPSRHQLICRRVQPQLTGGKNQISKSRGNRIRPQSFWGQLGEDNLLFGHGLFFSLILRILPQNRPGRKQKIGILRQPGAGNPAAARHPPGRPERSPFTSAMKTGTPILLKFSAKTRRDTVFPVPVAPAIRPCRLAILGSMEMSFFPLAIMSPCID